MRTMPGGGAMMLGGGPMEGTPYVAIGSPVLVSTCVPMGAMPGARPR